ncbi:MAG: hypothetical protein AAF242_13005, partial [Bacteroidota bacterium]
MSRLSTFIQLLLSCILMMPLALDGQNLTFCEDFESLTPGTRLGRSTNLEPGSTVLENETFRFSLEEFTYLNGTTGFEDILITQEDIFGQDSTGVGLFPSNINLKVNLLDPNLISKQLCFDFVYGGGEINFSVNDGFLIVIDNIDELNFYNNTEIVPGVFFRIKMDSTSNLPSGTICLEGPLRQLVIGGQELLIDNLCVTYQETNNPNLTFCEDFESLTPGTRLGRSTNLEPGATVLENENFRFSLEEFTNLNGTTSFEDVLVMREDMLGLGTTGNIGLWPSNINLKVDLVDTNLVSDQLCFDFAYGGGTINFSVNDGFLIVVDNIDELNFYNNTEIVPGVFFRIKIDSTNVPRGTICLEGRLNQLLIGGQELLVDNLCVSYQDLNPTCTIKNLKVEPYGCTPNDVFFLDYKFEWEDRLSGAYMIAVNNQVFGPLPYVQDTFPPIGPIQSFGDSIFFVQVYDSEFTACGAKTEFVYECNNLCPINAANAAITKCLPNGNFDILVKADFTTIYRDAPVEIFVDNQSVGTFRSGSFPIQLEDIPVFTEATFFEVKVCPLFTISLGDECCKSITLDKLKCPSTCPFEGVDARILECLPNGNFDIELDVKFSENRFGTPFQVFVDGNDQGIFQSDSLPIVLRDAPVYTDALDFTVTVCPVPITTDTLLNFDCCVSKTLHKDDCRPNESDCIGFESLPQESYGGDQNPPGTEIFNIREISFKLNPLQNLDWSTSYEKLSVLALESVPNFSAAENQVLLHQGISSIIDFQDYEQIIEEVSFDFYYEGGHLNLGVNGGQIQIIPFLSPGSYDLGNGIAVEIELSNASNGNGKMTFYGGNIQA